MKKKITNIYKSTMLYRFFRIIVILCVFTIDFSLLFAGITDEMNKTLPTGNWKFEKVAVEKKSDNYAQMTAATNVVFNKVDEVQSHIPFPQEWRISEKSIDIHYPTGMVETIENSLSENQLIVCPYDGTKQVYQCSILGENLTLTITHQYNNILYSKSPEQNKSDNQDNDDSQGNDDSNGKGRQQDEYVKKEEIISEKWVITLKK